MSSANTLQINSGSVLVLSHNVKYLGMAIGHRRIFASLSEQQPLVAPAQLLLWCYDGAAAALEHRIVSDQPLESDSDHLEIRAQQPSHPGPEIAAKCEPLHS